MKKIFLPLTGILFAAAVLASCTKTVSEAQFIAGAQKLSASDIAANLSVTCITPGSNKLVLENKNKGVSGMWDYNVGVSTKAKDEVVVPFLGEQTIKFYATCDTEVVLVEKKVTVTTIDFPSDPLWTIVAGSTMEGKDWGWNTGLANSGCYGAGGFGWSPLYPDWNSVSSGKGEWSEVEVFPDEYLHLDLNGAANAVLHKHDGTTVKGSFSVSSAVTPEKKDVGWLGTITFRGVTPPSAFTYYGNTPVGDTFEIAKLTDTELVLIQGDKDQANIFCDPNWASASTHWCFILK